MAHHNKDGLFKRLLDWLGFVIVAFWLTFWPLATVYNGVLELVRELVRHPSEYVSLLASLGFSPLLFSLGFPPRRCAACRFSFSQ